MWSLQALKLGCLLALAALPLLCGLLPALLFRLRGAAANGASRSRRSILSCAAGGVFMAACLLDVMPDSLADLRDELRRQSLSTAFPEPELVLALGFLLVLVLEHVMLDCSERPGAEATPVLERRQEAAVGEQRAEAAPSPFRSLVLVVSLSLHSAFEGLALGLQDTPSKVLRLAAAIVLHKCIIAASLGLLLLQSRLALPWLAAAVACFALMSPVGMGVGMAMPCGAGPGGSLARSVLEGVAAGTFLYITFLEILPQELHLPSGRLPKVLALLLGFSGMAGLRFLG
ncbi:zinc transporter ZIP1-like [Notechis scutatus]|uniref:Zinc transporter ZIP1-like n=1 Tax=Notechis scutatus TaxID=8663 RepID=A0A6J1VCH0_9SAUR|nr:zinc transporter ZIP1-like [Notechis scutatus]